MKMIGLWGLVMAIRRGKRVVPKGIKPVKKRLASGIIQVYHYHRATNTRLEHDPWTATGLLEIAALDARQAALETAVIASVPKSFASLWRAYRAAEFTRLRLRTRMDYDNVREWLGDAMEQRAVKSFTPEKIYALRDLALNQRGQRFANYVVAVLRIVFKWGGQRGWIKGNPAALVEAIPRASDARVVNRRLELDEVEALLSADTPKALLLPICLALFASMREGDALKITTAAYDGSFLRYTASKNQEPCKVPAFGLLKQLLDARMDENYDCLQIVVQRSKRPFTESGFRASFFKWVRSLVEDGKVRSGITFHGLRHTVGSLARDLGHSEFEVSAAIGDRSTAMAALYGRDALRQSAQIRVLKATGEHFAHINLETKLETTLNPQHQKAKKRS
jgi:integrase